MKQINSFYITRLLVAQHYEFHLSTATLLMETGTSVLHVADIYPEYLAAVQMQLAIINRNQHLANTALLKSIDTTRDGHLSQLFGRVDLALRSPVAAESAAAAALDTVLSPYRGIAKNEYTKETAQIRGLLRDLGTDAAAEQVNALKLGPTISAIRQTNNEFADAMEERIKLEAARTPTTYDDISTAEQRRVMDAIYHRLTQQINAFAIAAPAPTIDDYIDKQNALVEEYRRVISSQRPGGTGNESIRPTEDDEWPEER